MSNPWEKKIEERTRNIGFVSRLGAFREPTPAEKEAALCIEIKSWQATVGKKTYSTSAEYNIPIKTEYKKIVPTHRQEAINAYIGTPIDIGKETWLIMDWWTAIKHWFKGNKIKREEIK